jgi:trimethylamine--corrinoid protein Co-methyltransferase
MVTPYADPERGIFQALAQFYNLPAFGWGGVSDSKAVDQQAAAEAALTLLAESLVGGNIIHDLGYLESGLTFSLVQLVICEEMIGWVEAFLKGVGISDETLALDVIAQTGPEGHYLNKDHTRRHFREIWAPGLLDRNDYRTWKDRGSKTLGERAAERVEEILKEYQPEPLPVALGRQLRQIVQRAEAP